MSFQKIGFIGGGRICRVFLKAFERKGISLREVYVYDTDSDVCNTLRKQFTNIKIADSIEEVATSDLIILAIHPPVVMENLDKIKPFIKNNSIILSLAPKITIEAIKKRLGGFGRIARCNPNATSIINEGYNPVCFLSDLSYSDRENLLDFLRPLGKCPEVEEKKLEAYAVVSAMTPTYLWFIWDELYSISISFGLSEDETREVLRNVIPASVDVYLDYKMDAYNLIPARPLMDKEEEIRNIFRTYLTRVFDKLKN
jgi:pyrroline-5-carboxylate reductase